MMIKLGSKLRDRFGLWVFSWEFLNFFFSFFFVLERIFKGTWSNFPEGLLRLGNEIKAVMVSSLPRSVSPWHLAIVQFILYKCCIQCSDSGSVIRESCSSWSELLQFCVPQEMTAAFLFCSQVPNKRRTRANDCCECTRL